MKKIYLLLLLAFNAICFGQASDLIISEYGEGTTGNSKYIEIFNNTGATVNLSNYRIWNITNGGTWPESFIALTGTLANNSTYVIANNGTDVPGADVFNGTMTFNGDDAIGIAKDVSSVWTLIDVVGTDGVDPGTGWNVAGVTNATANNRLTRKTSICNPNTNWATSAGTDATNSEWVVSAYTTGAAQSGHSSCNTSPSISIVSPINATVFSPEVTSVTLTLAVQNFVVASGGTGNGFIKYSLNSGAFVDKFDTSAFAVTPVSGANTVLIKLVDNAGADLSPSREATVSFSKAAYTVVADIASLRADVNANGIGRYYQLSSNPIVSYARTARNQKYVQDATAGVLIDDNGAIITTPMVIGDAVAGLRGQSVLFAGVLQINPTINATVSSNSNTVVVQDVTLADFQTNYVNYESEMVRITDNVNFPGTNLNFVLNTNYAMTFGANTVQFRAAFSEAPYIGTASPTTAQNITGLGARTTISSIENPAIFAPNLTSATLSRNNFNAIEGLSIYPNPVTGKSFQITSATNASMNVSIYDVVGKEVLSSKVVNNTVNIEALNTGIYIVKVTEEGKTATRKLIVE